MRLYLGIYYLFGFLYGLNRMDSDDRIKQDSE